MGSDPSGTGSLRAGYCNGMGAARSEVGQIEQGHVAIGGTGVAPSSAGTGQPDPNHPALRHGSPAHLRGGAWKVVGKGVLKHTKKDRVNVLAGSLAYRWFLSLFPAIVVLLGLTALLRLPAKSVNTLAHGVSTALPAGASGVLTSAIRHAHGRTSGAVGALIVALVVALWSASSSMTVLQTSLDMAYEIPNDRKFLKKRAIALVLMVAVGVLGGLASALTVFGAQFGHAIAGRVPIGGVVFVAVWTAVRWLIAIGLVMMLMAVIYRVGPNRESPRWQWLSPGALIAAVLWVLASLAFSFYTSSFGSYGKTYGAFAGVAILILWLYVTGVVVLLGAEINAEVERVRTGRATVEATAGPTRAAA